MKPAVLSSLDLFTGCGGLTHALRNGIAHPVMYCEREESCIATLNTLMASNKIPKAPIHTDVRTLDGRPLKNKVQLIAGGFPCVGFSSVGLRQGFRNEQSGLFSHYVRLIREIEPACVFMENVAPITQGPGVETVCSELGKLGYVIWWLSAPAYVTNGECPHVRRRWFCLGVKHGLVGKLKLPVKAVRPFCWSKEPVPRMIVKGSASNTKRLGQLGNSVCAEAVRAAFLMLWTGTTDPQIAFRSGIMTLKMPRIGTRLRRGDKRTSGMCNWKEKPHAIYSIPPPVVPPRKPVKLMWDPKALP